MLTQARALHFVLKVADLRKNITFFCKKLEMKVLRHEVFDEGCEAACNGPYANKWSKTMIGYGPEDNNFVLELTYNYSVGQYDLGTDLQHIDISLKSAWFDEILKHEEIQQLSDGDKVSLKSPDGYKFNIERNDSYGKNDIVEVCLSCSNLQDSRKYWMDLLGMKLLSMEEGDYIKLQYSPDQAVLKLKQTPDLIDHKSAYGRIAFSCPSSDLKPLQAAVEAANHKILTPYTSLETPGKTVVQVVILADPDGHEICFVGDEGFRELSQVDSDADNLVENSMDEDKSNEWFQKKGVSKSKA